MMTKENMNGDNPVVIEIDDVIDTTIYFNWGGNGIGFGQLDIRKVDGKFICYNECMSRQQVRELLIAYANHMADIVELADPNESSKGFEKIPPIIKGVVKVCMDFFSFKEGTYVEKIGDFIKNTNGDMLQCKDIPYGGTIPIRGYVTKEELLSRNNV